MRYLLSTLAICLFAFACKSPAPQKPVDASPAPSSTASQAAAAPELKFASEDLSPKDNKSGFEIVLKTLKASGGAAGVSDAINAELQKNLHERISLLAENPKEGSLEELIKAATANYATIKKENPNEQEWSFELNDVMQYESAQILSIVRSEYSYTGGAHPNGHSDFFNFDPKTGKVLTKADLIADEKGLLPVVEKHFRKHWAEVLGETKGNLGEAGFSFENEAAFALPKNISIDKTNLILLYNTYEIAPYVMGETDLRIPLEEVKQFLKIQQ